MVPHQSASISHIRANIYFVSPYQNCRINVSTAIFVARLSYRLREPGSDLEARPSVTRSDDQFRNRGWMMLWDTVESHLLLASNSHLPRLTVQVHYGSRVRRLSASRKQQGAVGRQRSLLWTQIDSVHGDLPQYILYCPIVIYTKRCLVVRVTFPGRIKRCPVVGRGVPGTC